MNDEGRITAHQDMSPGHKIEEEQVIVDSKDKDDGNKQNPDKSANPEELLMINIRRKA